MRQDQDLVNRAKTKIFTVHENTKHGNFIFLNPLDSKGNYSATLNVGTLAGTFGTARRRLSGASAHPGPSSLYHM